MASLSTTKMGRIDGIGILLSVGCLIHCTILPVLALFWPQISTWLGFGDTHLILLFLIAPVAMFSFWQCYRKHGRKDVVALGIAGVLFLSLAVVLEPYGEIFDIGFTLAGSLALVSGHLANLRMCRCVRGKGHC